jgi:two-component system chemotaxis response regulator CheY
LADTRADELLRNASVLIADRSQSVRRLTRSMLINLGIRSIAEAEDGLSTLEAITSGKPDALVIDWDLPKLSGLEVIRTVRRPGQFPRADLPIIMLTAWAERRYVLKALRCGANEFLAKPTSTLALKDRLISVLGRRRAMVRLGNYYVPAPRVWPPKLREDLRD